MSEVKMRKYGCVDCCDEIPATEKYCSKCKESRKSMTVCKNCNKKFIFKKDKNAYSTGYYCDRCLSKKEELPLEIGNCSICDNKFYKKSTNHKYCSDKCKDSVISMLDSDRFIILERDGFRCMYCGSSATDGAKLLIDHIFPYSKGGEHTAENLITACSNCNQAKHNKIINIESMKHIKDYVEKANLKNGIHPQRFIKGSHTRGDD